MRNYLIYIIVSFTIIVTSCTDDAMMDFSPDVVTDIDMQPADTTNGIYVALPDLVDGNDGVKGVISRSSLAYNRAGKNMAFSWDGDYTIHVTPIGNITTLLPQKFQKEAATTEAASSGHFIGPDGVSALTKNKEYLAFRPWQESPQFDYTKRTVNYADQTQNANVKMKLYYENTDDYAAYDASEVAAAAHLGNYDYLTSAKQTTSEAGSIYFHLRRIGAVVRFYIKNPAQEVFEQLQLVAQGPNPFILEGEADLSSMGGTISNPTITIKPVSTSNVMTLSYGTGGIDMTDQSSDYYDYYNSKYTGYIVSYMMLAPVDLSTATDIRLYLVSHQKGENEKKYYKSNPMSKPNLTSNMFYRWVPAGVTNPDTPITFTEVTFQKYKEDTKIYNGDSGSGTEGW